MTIKRVVARLQETAKPTTDQIRAFLTTAGLTDEQAQFLVSKGRLLGLSDRGLNSLIGDNPTMVSAISRNFTKVLGPPKRYVENFMPHRVWFIRKSPSATDKTLGTITLAMEPGGIYVLSLHANLARY